MGAIYEAGKIRINRMYVLIVMKLLVNVKYTILIA